MATLLVALSVAACGTSATGDSTATSPGGSGLVVMATTSMLGDVARAVVGEAGTVEVLIPRGADPHDFSPSSQQVARLAEADLVVATGLGLEGGFSDVIEAAESAHMVEVAPLVDPLPLATSEADQEHDHDGLDPHIHMDPQRMAGVADIVAAELAGIDPSGDWAARASAFGEEMAALDERITDILSEIPPERRLLVTLHDALGYFADRYGFTVVGTVVPGGSTLADPSSADLAELVRLIDEHQVTAIFAETTVSPTLGEAVAAEVGRDVEVVPLYVDSLGEPGSGADTLAGMLELNATRVAAALRAGG